MRIYYVFAYIFAIREQRNCSWAIFFRITIVTSIEEKNTRALGNFVKSINFFTLYYKWENGIVTTILMLICILMNIKKIYYAWEESWNWKKVRWRGWRSKRPEICSPANFAAQTVAKQLIVHLPPSSARPASAVVCGSDRVVSGSDERGRAELEPARRVFAKCLIKTFVVSCGARGSQN